MHHLGEKRSESVFVACFAAAIGIPGTETHGARASPKIYAKTVWPIGLTYFGVQFPIDLVRIERFGVKTVTNPFQIFLVLRMFVKS